MAAADPQRRRRAASLAANISWARTDSRAERTAAARRALQAKWETEVDPEGVMAPADRTKAAQAARRAYYQRLSRKGNDAQREQRSA